MKQNEIPLDLENIFPWSVRLSPPAPGGELKKLKRATAKKYEL